MDARDVTQQDGGRDRAEGEGVRPAHLGFVAHEIRNPLSTALWTAELLARMPQSERGGARGEKLSGMCLRSILRVRQLVEDHLLCERLDAGGFPLRVEAIGAREAADGVLERRSTDEPATAHIDPALGIEADAGLLDRALDALVAVAGAERTPVSVTARATHDEVSLLVNGRRAESAALVDPVKGASSDHSGRALAVPLARRIAAALAGALTAEDGSWVLTLRRARAYTPRPKSGANP